MLEIDTETLSYILTICIAIFSIFTGLGWRYAKIKITQIRKLAVVVDNALYDDKISETEFQIIFKSLNDLIGK